MKIRYIARAEAGKGWRIWNRKTNRTWGNYFKYYPTFILEELNNLKRPEVLTRLVKESYGRPH